MTLATGDIVAFIAADAAKLALERVLQNDLSATEIQVSVLGSSEASWTLNASFVVPRFRIGPFRFGKYKCMCALTGHRYAQVEESFVVTSYSECDESGTPYYCLWQVLDCVYLKNGSDLPEVLAWFKRR